MEETLESYVLNSMKSQYRVELLVAENGKQYVTINQRTQTYFTTDSFSQVKIHPDVLDDLIDSLQKIAKSIGQTVPKKRRTYLERNKGEVVYRYLNKKLELEELAVQFRCSVNDIKLFLKEAGIPVMSNKMPPPSKKYWRKRRRRYS